MIPFLASTMFQNQLTSNWGRNDETKKDKKDYLKILKFEPMLVKVNASHILADFKPQLINLSMIKEVRQGWSNLEDGTPKENWSQIDFIDGNSIYVQSNIDSFLQNDRLDTALKNVLGDANSSVDEDAKSKSSKFNGVTQALLDYIQYSGVPICYSELNAYYRKITKGSNSFSHILKAMMIPYKNRPTQRYVVKDHKYGRYTYYSVKVANSSNWVIK